VKLTVRHTTPDIRCTQLSSLTMTTKATFCQLPTTNCFHCQPCSCDRLRYAYISFLSSLKLWQTKHITVDSCDGGISVLNHRLLWSKFVKTHTYTTRDSGLTYA